MKTLVHSIAILVLCACAFNATAADKTVELTTPRASLIKLDIYNPGSPAVLLLAPGSSCSPRLDMYDALALEAKTQPMTLVRVYWAYCLTKPTGTASDDLATEKEDFLTALDYVKNELGYPEAKIFVGGKSLGTFVSFEVFQAQSALAGLLMLTPVCTDAADPKDHKNIFAENYPNLLSETRSVLLVQGNVDPLCDTNHLQDSLRGVPNNFVSMVTKGDHGLGIKNPDGQYNADLSALNLKAIARWVFAWLK